MKRKYKVGALAALLVILAGQAAPAGPLVILVLKLLGCSFLKIGQSTAGLLLNYHFLENLVMESIKEMVSPEHLKNLILFPESSIITETVIVNLVEFFTQLMMPFYALVLSATSFYLIFSSGSIVGRARAKSTLIKMILALVVTIFTIPIMQLLLDISRIVSSMVLNFADIGIASELFVFTTEKFSEYILWLMIASYWAGFPIFMIFSTFAVGTFIVLSLRFFMIVLWTVLFPASVILYSFHLTRRLGSAMFQQTFQWIFLQLIAAFLLLSISVAVGAMPEHFLSNSYFRMSFGAVSFALFIILPFMTMGIMDMMAIVTMFGGIEVSTSGLITTIDEITVEEVGTTDVTPPSPVKPF